MKHEKLETFSPDEQNLLASLTSGGPGFYALVGTLCAVIVWGIIAYSIQLRDGLGVTGLRNNMMWGVYITNFVFFIGVSHVGALMSAILRITGADWRAPITRMAEAITFAALTMGALMPLIDMGRPDRLLNIFLHGRLQSPIVWDIIGLTTYLTGSTLFLYVPMLPDIAMLRDRFAAIGPAWRHRLYSILSLGWKGTEVQVHSMDKIMNVMAILIIPVAVSVHTVVSFIFSMTLRAGWDSTVFGPYFVFGALFSGSAGVVTAMVAFRRAYRLDNYITVKHFRRMDYLMITLGVIYAYFTFVEYFTPAFKMAAEERGYLMSVLTGPFAGLFWFVQVPGLLLPLFLLTLPRLSWTPRLMRVLAFRPRAAGIALTTLLGLMALIWLMPSGAAQGLGQGVSSLRSTLPWVAVGVGIWAFLALMPVFHKHPVAASLVASVLINLGAWVKRYVIILPTLAHPFMPVQNLPLGWAVYRPTWVEWSITAASMAAFALIYILFSKLFPIVSIWETRELSYPSHASDEPVSAQTVHPKEEIADAPTA